MSQQEQIETRVWCGQLRYLCPLNWESGARCEYDTYDMAALREHMRQPHNRSGKPDRQPQILRRPSSLVDSRGNQMVQEVEVPQDFGECGFRE